MSLFLELSSAYPGVGFETRPPNEPVDFDEPSEVIACSLPNVFAHNRNDGVAPLENVEIKWYAGAGRVIMSRAIFDEPRRVWAAVERNTYSAAAHWIVDILTDWGCALDPIVA